MARPRLVIIDGYSLLFRAFYGGRYLSTSDGRPTNALFGFVSMLFSLLEKKPDAIVVALDAPGKTFRHAEFAEYKGTRRDTPDELVSQLVASRDVVTAFGIPVLELTGYEADDVVGTVSRQAENNGYDTTIVTGDLDALQLVDPCVSVMTTLRGVSDVKIYDETAVFERYGFLPANVPDYKALVGDTSDNIPGVPGIGDKTATLLIQKFGPVEELVRRIDEVEPKFRKKLEGNLEQLPKSKWLATIVRDAPVAYDFAPYAVGPENLAAVREMMATFEFRTHARRVDTILRPYMTEAIADPPVAVTAESLQFRDLGSGPYESLREWIGARVFGLDFRPSEGLLAEASPAYVAVGDEVRQVSPEDARRLLREAPRQASVSSAKPWYRSEPGLPLLGFDVQLAAFVLQPGRSSYAISDLTQGYLLVHLPDEPAARAVALAQLRPCLEEALAREGQDKVFREIEMPLAPVLVRMEDRGIAVSRELLGEISTSLETEIEVAQAKVFELAGGEFNIGSPKQLGEVLFERLQIPGAKKTKTGYATGIEILGELAGEHEIAAKVLEWRELTKLKNTYVDSLPKLIARDGRIHTTYNQMGAVTGRLSSNDPNLQNIPIRTERGRQIRRAFVAAPGKQLVSLDYSQIELRVLAHMCADPQLIEAFHSGDDVHAVTAGLMFGLELDQVAKEQRRLAKMLNYAVLYGVTEFGLKQQLGPEFSMQDARGLIQQYNERFPSIKRFTEGVADEARSKGFTVTLLGRRRYFPEIHAANRAIRMGAERQAINAPIQGTAADMIKLAMLRIAEEARTDCDLLLQVHDELVFEAPERDPSCVEPIRAHMEQALELAVPVEVDAKVGPNWLDMSEVPR